MNENDRIDIGDRVDIFFQTLEPEFDVEVLDTPAATGDCWKLKRQTGIIVYVQQFDRMIRTYSPRNKK